MVDEKPNQHALMAIFNNVGKMTISYNNGSTLTLEGEALINFLNFQKSLLFLYTTFAGAMENNKDNKEQPKAPQQPLTRTTLADQLRNNKKGQS